MSYGIILERAKKKLLNHPKRHCREDLQRHLNNNLYKGAKLTGKQVVFKANIERVKNPKEYVVWAKALTEAVFSELYSGKKKCIFKEKTTEKAIVKKIWQPGPIDRYGNYITMGKYITEKSKINNIEVEVKMPAEVLGNPFFASFYLGCLVHLADSARSQKFVKQKPPSTALKIFAAMKEATSRKIYNKGGNDYYYMGESETPLNKDYKEKWQLLVKTSKYGVFENLIYWRMEGNMYGYSEMRGVNDWYKSVKNLEEDRKKALNK